MRLFDSAVYRVCCRFSGPELENLALRPDNRTEEFLMNKRVTLPLLLAPLAAGTLLVLTMAALPTSAADFDAKTDSQLILG